MKFLFAFGALGLLCLAKGCLSEQLGMKFLWSSLAIAAGGVALAYAGIGSKIFLKGRDGRLHPLSLVICWPYHLLNHLSFHLFRWLGKGNAVDEVAPHLFLGRRLTHRESEQWLGHGVAALLDLTCEFSESRPLRERVAYRCLPVLDTEVPSSAGLEDALRWMREQTEKGPLFVHCALGHGRSATVIAAYLLQTQAVSSLEEALARLTEVRPGIRLSRKQIAFLQSHYSLSTAPKRIG